MSGFFLYIELMKKPTFILLSLLPLFMFSQQNGTVFKQTATNPTENINIGHITVTKTMYGITFKDATLTEPYKQKVRLFFKQRYNGYATLQQYRLKIEKRFGVWYVENHKLPQ